MNKRGLVSVKMLILSLMMISIFLVLFLHLKQRNNINNGLREQTMILNSTLANYDSYLYKNYGLYGVKESNNLGTFKTGWPYKVLSERLVAKESLANPKVIKNQIVNLMALRMPSNFLKQMENKLELIGDSEKTKSTLEIKDKVYDYLQGFDDLIQQRSVYTIEINEFDQEALVNKVEVINQAWSSWYLDYKSIKAEIEGAEEAAAMAFKAYEDYKASYLTIVSPSEKETLLLEEKYDFLIKSQRLLEEYQGQGVTYEFYGKDILKDFEILIEDVEEKVSSHEALIKTMAALKEKKTLVLRAIDETVVEISKSDGLEMVLEAIEDEMTSLSIQLEDEMVSQKHIEKMMLDLNENIKRLKGFLNAMKLGPQVFDREQLIDPLHLRNLQGYKNDFQLYMDDGSYEVDAEKEELYEKAKAQEDETYEEASQGAVIGKDIEIIAADGSGKFWPVTGLKNQLKNSYEALMVNEYLLSTFKCYGNTSDSDFDFFEKYTRSSLFINGEIEYILFGDASESKNITKTLVAIYGVRTLMNTLHIYMDPEKIAYSEAIGWGVAGWTGFLAPVVTQVVRVAWAAGESAIDVKNLLDGQGVSFLKVYPSEWQLDLGMVSNSPEQAIKGFQLTYHDYLRFMLLTLKSETKLARLQNLIALNLHTAKRPYVLKDYKTSYESQRILKLMFGNYESKVEKSYE